MNKNRQQRGDSSNVVVPYVLPDLTHLVEAVEGVIYAYGLMDEDL